MKRKRSVGSRGGRGKAAPKRNAARDLSARAARTVVGGLLPVAQAARGVAALAQAPSTREIDQQFNYEKFKYE